MAAKLLFSPHFNFLSPRSSKLLSHLNPSAVKPPFPSLCSVTAQFTSTFPDQNLSYGPSLQKGNTTYSRFAKTRTKVEEDDIDRDSFTRVFDIAALRVPSKDCFVLENRLRGHLLNWPRIRNIARVPGDEIDEEIADLLEDNDSGSDTEGSVSLQRRIYGKADGDGEELSPVLYREKLATTFNSRGFVKFRNLAKISRPKKKRKKGEDGVDEGNKGIGKNDFAVVEVLEDENDGEDMRGLIGEEFKGRTWRGSTRLLLLDERYANRGIQDLPQAVKVAVLNILILSELD